jgi:hypothetical protein
MFTVSDTQLLALMAQEVTKYNIYKILLTLLKISAKEDLEGGEKYEIF